jgi:tungstate transport system substrate-binding protein
VHVLAQGTGQTLQTAARDDADLVLVHNPEAEQKFMAAGDGIDRGQIAWNDFILVGPRSDPAHIGGGQDAVAAFKATADARRPLLRISSARAGSASATARDRISAPIISL